MQNYKNRNNPNKSSYREFGQGQAALAGLGTDACLGLLVVAVVIVVVVDWTGQGLAKVSLDLFDR